MRLSSRTVVPVVTVVAESASRPVRMNMGGATYRMDLDEAIDLANQLADAVEKTQRITTT